MSMSDRELLEFAAKAAGYEVVWCSWYGRFSGDVSGFRFGDSIGQVWNPLQDDGDALRLAVKLGIDITFPHPSYVMACRGSEYIGPWNKALVQGRDDYGRATRQAIAYTAALIGKAMQEQKK